jgi:trk system potassium uptake protein
MANKRKRVMIIGGGKTGSYLATLLLNVGCEVRVLESRHVIANRLATDLPTGVATHGDGTDPTVLEQNGIANMDVVAAVTGDDEANLVVASLAKFEYQVERVIMRINNPRNAWLCTPEMGVDAALNQSDLIATLIVEEMSVGDLQTLVKLRQGAVEIVEETIPDLSKAIDKPLSELGLPPDCNITAIIRGAGVIIPHGSTTLQAGDEVVAVIRSDLRNALARALE